MVGRTGAWELGDFQTRTGAILQQPDLREGHVEGRRGGREGPTLPTRSLGRNRAAGEAGPASLRAAGAAHTGPRPPPAPSSLEGLPLLPELLHRARGRGRAHVLLAFP